LQCCDPWLQPSKGRPTVSHPPAAPVGCTLGGYFGPLLTLEETLPGQAPAEETVLSCSAAVQAASFPTATAVAAATEDEDLSWWDPQLVTKTVTKTSGDVMHASPPVFSRCRSLAAGPMPARARFTSALLHDRILHSKQQQSDFPEDMPTHGCPNLHEARVNASLTYRASLLKIKGRYRGSAFTVLMDDGAAINIVSRRKVRDLGLPTFTLPTPIAVSQFQGQHVDNCSEAVFIPITVTSKKFSDFTINTDVPFIIMDLDGSFDMIMGMPTHEQYSIAKQYTSRDITFFEKGKSFTVHSYDRHVNHVQAAAVISHIAANHLQNTSQIAESFCVFVSLPSAPQVPVCSTQGDHATSPPPASAPTPDQAPPQPVGADAPQPAAPHQPAVGQHLSPDHKAEVSKVLHAYRNVFAEPSGINPHLSPFHIKQKTGVPERPFIRYARRLTLEERAAVELTIEKFLAKGWIQPSDSEWGAPIMFVRKQDGSLRAVVDYRQLNAQSSSDGVKLPLLSECLQSMAGRKFYSKLDLADGYFQVPMDIHSIHKTAFTTGEGRQFHWLVMPMGLKGAPNHFCRIMHNTLKHLIKDGVCVVYLDDILIASNTFQEHLHHISLVLAALAKVDLRAKPSKCQFAFQSVDFLGHHVGPEGIGTQPSKVEAITSFPVPSCASHLESFLGLVGFYSPLLPNLSTACALLRSKANDWHASGWSQEHQAAYDNVKQLVSSAPFLHAVDPHKPFHIHLDASKLGAGATLSQDFGSGLQPVAYFSRKLLPYQTRYLNGKRELLALILALRQWRHWVGGVGVTVHAYTDHSNNTQIFNSSFSVEDTTVAGWLLEMQRDYPGLHISHIPGTQNLAADALSRNPDFVDDTLDLHSPDTPAPDITSPANPLTHQHDPHPDHLTFSDGYLTPDIASEAFESCDSAASRNRSSSSGDSNLGITMTNSEGFQVTVPGRESTDSSSSSDLLMFRDGAWGLVGNVMGFSGDSLSPVFTSCNSITPADQSSLHDKFDTPVLPVYAFTGAALTLHHSAQLQSKFITAYTTDAYLLAHKPAFTLREGLYYRPSGALYVPAACVKLVLELEHDQGGHHGQVETERRVRRKFWFPNLHALVKEYVRGCVTCGRSKPSTQALRAPLSFREFSDTQWDQVSMDFVCGLPVVSGGFDRVLTVVDRGLTKRAHFIKCKSTHTATHIAQLFLDNVYVHHGLPSTIITDQDPLFMSNFYKGLMSKLQVKLQPGAVYHPQSDGQSEVTNRILKTYLIKFCQDHPSQWHNHLFRAEFEYNYSQKTTGYSAFQLDMGRQPRRIEDALIGEDSHVPAVEELFEQQTQVLKNAKAALNRAFQLAAKQHDKKTRPTQVAVGDRVYLSTLHLNIPVPGGVKKFKQPYTGPFKVVKVSSSGGAATLELPCAWQAARTWNVEYLKHYTATSSPVFDESADSLASIAVRDDSVEIGGGNPIFGNNTAPQIPGSNQMGDTPMQFDKTTSDIPVPASVEIGVGNPIFDSHTAPQIPGSTKVGDTHMQPDETTSDIILPASHKVVLRIADYRSARGKRKAQYLLVFKDQPLSENMWVDTDECVMFVGFDAALKEHQCRRVLRSAV